MAGRRRPPERAAPVRIHLVAVGPLKSGPERDLVDDYLDRAARCGRGLGVREVREAGVASGGGCEAEGERLLARCPPGARIICLDERGENAGSARIADLLAGWRDGGEEDVCFLIGGADGHGEAVRQAASHTLSFGAQTWPHRLVRVMLAEQVYRALTILAGTPYHKA